jgi:hypothetical protein
MTPTSLATAAAERLATAPVERPANGAVELSTADAPAGSAADVLLSSAAAPVDRPRHRPGAQPVDLDARVVPRRARSTAVVRCRWCGRRLPDQDGVGRRRQYCTQSCRQRAYENRHPARRGGVPADGIMLTAEERDDLADRLYQMQCAAEDVATALAESAERGELVGLVAALLDAARAADRIR